MGNIYCFVCLILLYSIDIWSLTRQPRPQPWVHTVYMHHFSFRAMPCRGRQTSHGGDPYTDKGPEPKDTTERCTENAIDISSQTGDIRFK